MRWRRASATALSAFIRYAPTERQRVFVLTIVIGVTCGLAAVAFHQVIQGAEHYLIENAVHRSGGDGWMLWAVLTPVAGGLCCGLLLHYVVPGARGSGIPQVKVAFAVKGGNLPFRQVIGKFLIGALQIGSGASLGREGPTVQICAGLASLFGRLTALSRQNMKRLLPVGAAAGIAAAFNAPIAAVTFAIEEIVGDLDQTILSGIVVAAALASVIERYLLGSHPVFEIHQQYGLNHASSLVVYAALGVAAALISVTFTDSLLRVRKFFRQLKIIPAWAHPAIGGLITGLLAVVAIRWLGTGGIYGGGYEALSEALEGRLDVQILLALCVLKMAATVSSYSSGGAGGIFAPTLMIGAAIGGAFGHLDVLLLGHSEQEIGAFALVGMGAVFAGIIRAPITSVLIIIEMTNGYSLILPLMISNMTSFVMARRWRPTPIYEALLEQDEIYLPHRKTQVSHALEQISVSAAMTTDLVTLPANGRVGEALELVERHQYSSFPILDAEGHFAGLITKARLRRSAAEKQMDITLDQLADRKIPLYPDQRLVSAILLMNELETRQLAVVDREDARRLIGLISMSDIVKAQAKAALEAVETGSPVTEGAKKATTRSADPDREMGVD